MLTEAESQLRVEFNEWAIAGRGESMERGHAPVGRQAIAKMGLNADSKVLDVGCGSGWACRLIAETVTDGEIVGIDVSDEMIRIARRSSVEYPNVRYEVAGAAMLPFDGPSFTHAFSMESIYYHPDILSGLSEVKRVLYAGASFCAVVDLFRENEPTSFWVEKLKVPVHYLGTSEYIRLFESAGFRDVVTETLLDPSPVDDEFDPRWYRSLDDYKRYREIGSLMIKGSVGNV